MGSWIKPNPPTLKSSPIPLPLPVSSQTFYLQIPDGHKLGLASVSFENRAEEWLGLEVNIWAGRVLSRLHHAPDVLATQPPGSRPDFSDTQLSIPPAYTCTPFPTPTNSETSIVLWFLLHFRLFVCVC